MSRLIARVGWGLAGGGVSRPIPRGRWGGGLLCPGPHPGGVHAHTHGGPGPGSVSQHALRQTLPSRWLLLRAVRILLECILVIHVTS